MKSLPFCSIIILNYQGENVIENCLNSIWNLDYPKNKYEVIVVDNNSMHLKNREKNKLVQRAKPEILEIGETIKNRERARS